MISHLSQVATKLGLVLNNECVKAVAYFHEQGSVLRGDAEGFCDHIEIEISVESEESQDKLCALFQLTRKMCFTEKALTDSAPITVKQKLNGVEL